MKLKFAQPSGFPSVIRIALFFTSPLMPLAADVITWNNSSTDGKWSTPANWDGGLRPQSIDDAIFPASLGGTITLDQVYLFGSPVVTAQSIQFNDNYTANGGPFDRINGDLDIGVSGGSLVTFNAGIMGVVNLVKSGGGSLVLTNGANTPSAVTINGGTLRTTVAGGLGGAGSSVSILNGSTLEIGPNAATFLSPISMADGTTLRGLGTVTTQDTLTIDPAATSITFGTVNAADILQVTDNSYEISGGSASTIIHITGPGTVRPGSRHQFDGTWQVHDGLLDIRPAAAVSGAPSTTIVLGDNPAGSVTFAGGDFRVRSDSGPMNLTDSQANNIFLNTDTTFTSERLTTSNGVTHTVGSTTLGSHTFTVLPGSAVNSGEAGFEMTRLTLNGDPVLALPGTASADSELIINGIDGGATPRAITVTGDGDLTFHGGGTNALADGSTISVTGGGNLLLSFPPIGPDPVTLVTMGQNPIGDADLSITDGTLLLRGSGAANIYGLSNHLTLGGNITVDPDRNVSGFGTDVFRMAGITLKPAAVVNISGDNSFGLGSEGPLVLQGNATLQGFSSGSTADGVCFLYGGISGGPSSALTIGNTSRPINLTIGASSTYGGGTVMNGGNVTLSAASGFGTGTTTLNGGNLTLNADAALNGTVTINGGNLIVTGQNVLAANPIILNGGLLDLRTTATATLPIPSLTVSGTSAMSFSRFGSTSSFVVTTPVIDVLGATTLTISNGASTTHLIPQFDLAGDLTVSASSATRVTSITEDGTPRKFIKTGTAQLDLEGVSSHSGGTEVLAGTLYVENSGALGSGTLTIGATSGTAAATVRFLENLTIPNDIVVRSGNSGLMTIDAETGRLIWNGNVDLQKSVTLDNGSATAADLSYFNGVVSGAGDITKISGGEIVLSNAANSFGSGTPTSISISAGTLTVASNGALGNTSNGVNLTSSGILKVTGTFSTPRTFTVSGTASDVNVTSGNTLTVNSPFAGTGTFNKGDLGTLEIGPAVDATARGSAITTALGGVLRVQGQKNLGDASPITVDGGTFAFHRDANTNFGHPVTVAASGGIHVDRAVGGAGSNGRHTLGAVSTTSTGTLTATGDNGYGLSLGAYTATNNSGIINNAPGNLVIASVTGNPATSARTLTLGGSGNIDITGALGEGAGTGTYGLNKSGTGTLRFGSSVADFARITTVNDGILDLNGLAYATDDVTLGGTASLLGARIVTGAGSLILGDDLTFSATGSPAGGRITGSLGLTGLPHDFVIGNSAVPATDLTLDGPISGSAGATIFKSGAGTLQLTGPGNTLPDLFTVSDGVLELAKSSGDGIGTGGLAVTGDGKVLLLGGEQIRNSAPVTLDSSLDATVELNNFTETVGPLTLTQTSVSSFTSVKTGASGTLVLNGNLTFNNNVNSVSNDERNVVITGTGSEFTPAFDGTLDLGGATRTIHVTTTTVGANEPKANATIETRIINGGILKTGPRTLFLTNPNNSFSGGLNIAGGTVRSVGGTSLGLGPVSFSNALGVAAGIDFGTSTGPLAENYTLTGAGDATFTYSGISPNTLVLSGDFNTAQNLIFDVVNGTVVKGSSAVLDATGTIDDAAGTTSLRKRGNGTLKLAAGNTYSGDTVIEKGILAISADSALGDTTAPLTLDGGCLANSAPFTLSRDLTVSPNGGNIRSNEIPQTLEIAGSLAWSSATTTIDGSGRTVISGSTTGPDGNLVLGAPIAFATGSTTSNTWNSRVCLLGPAALPGGNLSFDNFAVLELGNGNFTRPLGTGSGQVQLPTSRGGGWAAVGADRSVNLGGAGALLLWGQTSPAFLHNPSGGVGALVLGSISGTHTVEFQNPLDFNTATSSVYRSIITNDGAALVDARITGDLGVASSLNEAYLELYSHGTLEITGDILGPVSISHYGAGRTILSGNNDLTGTIYLGAGTLEFANDASFGAPDYISISSAATLDASAMTVPVSITPGGSNQIEVNGLLDGSALAVGTLRGIGEITGNVVVQNASNVSPDFGGTLRIGGDLTINPGASINLSIQGTTPEADYTRLQVSGGVNLNGGLSLLIDGFNIPQGFTGTIPLILNGGNDPINGTFTGLPEGSTNFIFNDPYFRSLRVTYLANADGGPIGNDFAVTLVSPFTSPFQTWIDSFPSLTNPADKTKAANPDKDDLNNLGEFALDGDPASGKASGKTVGIIAPVGGVNVMTLTIPVRDFTIPDIDDPAGGELVLSNATDTLTYRLQASDNLSSFGLDVTEVTGPDATDIQNGLLLPPLNTGWSYRTFRSPGAVSGDPSEFMRVQIEE